VSAPALHGAQLAPIPGRWSADAPFQAHDNLSLQVVYRITPSMSMFQRKKLLIPAQIPVFGGDSGVFAGLEAVVGAFPHS